MYLLDQGICKNLLKLVLLDIHDLHYVQLGFEPRYRIFAYLISSQKEASRKLEKLLMSEISLLNTLVHVGGTNGKGSTSHMLSSILQGVTIQKS